MRVAIWVLVVYAGVLIVLVALENELIFYPLRYPSGNWAAADWEAPDGQLYPRIEDSFFTASDGVRLHGWYAVPHRFEHGESRAQAAPMIVLWFHGNAGNITHRYDMLRGVVRLPARVLLVDYRGYGRSEGSPSEEGLYRDARAAWDYLTAERGARPEQIVVLGKSLGSAPAIELATHVEPAGLVVQSGFTSVPDMARVAFPFVPKFLVRTQMNSLARIGDIRCPKLFIHSPADEVVPYRLGRRLFDAAAEPKRFFEVPRAGHNETYLAGGAAYWQALRTFLQECSPR